MKRNRIILLLTAIALFSCSKDAPVATVFSGDSVLPVLNTDILTVRLSDEAAQAVSSGLPDELAGIGVVEATPVFVVGGRFESRQRASGLHKWYSLRFEGKAPDFALTRAGSLPSIVEYWEKPVARKMEGGAFSDPMLADQWHLAEGGTVRRAWEEFNAGDGSVTVAVIDGGIDLLHPDLAKAVLAPGEKGSRCFIEGMSPDTITPVGHGTHVAGIIGAVNNNGEGVCGIAGGDDGEGGVRLMSCQVFLPDDDTTGAYGNTAAAIQWAADNGAVIANNSWSYDFDSEEEAARGWVTEADKAAIDYFIQYAGCDNEGNQLPDSPMKGGLVVFAAGNDGWAYSWPGGYEPVFAVGSVNKDNVRAKYSNYGSWVDICAPGGEMEGGDKYGILSTYYDKMKGHCYAYSDGSSMAAPNVSGVAALIISQYGGEGFTADSLKSLLVKGADAISVSPEQKIGPLVNAYGSLASGVEYDLRIYPNPVSDILVIRPKKDCRMDIEIYTSAGSLVFSKSVNASKNSPARLDVSACIPGVYNLVVRMDGEVYKNSFVKK